MKHFCLRISSSNKWRVKETCWIEYITNLITTGQIVIGVCVGSTIDVTTGTRPHSTYAPSHSQWVLWRVDGNLKLLSWIKSNLVLRRLWQIWMTGLESFFHFFLIIGILCVTQGVTSKRLSRRTFDCGPPCGPHWRRLLRRRNVNQKTYLIHRLATGSSKTKSLDTLYTP